MTAVIAHPQLSPLLHAYYALGARIWDTAQIYKMSNAQIQTLATQIVTDRSNLVNTSHIALLTNIANSSFS